jgi:hypothetical protein
MRTHPAHTTIRRLLPWAIIVSGMLLSLYLVWLIPGEVFFSGDGGVKVLLTKQFARGALHVDLRLPAETWVREIWDEGFYPYGAPYIYEKDAGYFASFPFYFPLTAAPLYALFGFRGLYLIPLLSLWLLWLIFRQVCRRLGLSDSDVSIALVVLIFASPLTLYGAIYWEHTLSVLLAFSGIAVVLIPPTEKTSRGRAVIGGVLLGLSAWFRPELLLIVFIMCLLAFTPSGSTRFSKNRLYFVLPSLLMVSLMVVVNLAVYGHPLGVHSAQVLDDLSLRNRILDPLVNLLWLAFGMFAFFPVAILALPSMLTASLSRRSRVSPNTKLMSVLCLAFLVAVPFMLPNSGGKQWGPRYLLILVPILTLLVLQRLNSVRSAPSPSTRNVGIVIFVSLLAAGVALNTYVGIDGLRKDYQQRTYPALEFLRQHSSAIVSVCDQYLPQELEAVVGEKVFFAVRGTEELLELSALLQEQGYQEMLYGCYGADEMGEQRSYTLADEHVMAEFSPMQQVGEFGFREVAISAVP